MARVAEVRHLYAGHVQVAEDRHALPLPPLALALLRAPTATAGPCGRPGPGAGACGGGRGEGGEGGEVVDRARRPARTHLAVVAVVVHGLIWHVAGTIVR